MTLVGVDADDCEITECEQVMAALIIVLLLLGTALVLLRWWSAPPAVSEPRCARCGYPVRGLTGDVCPECGSDLSQRGAVLVPGVQPRSGPISRLICWSLAMFLHGLVALSLASEIPNALVQRQTWFVTLGGAPDFGYRSLQVDVESRAWRERDLRPWTGSITLARADGTTTTLLIDRQAMTMRASRAAPQQAMNEAKLRDWLVACGATGTPGQLDYQARVLLEAVRTLDIGAAMNVAPHDDWTMVGPNSRRLLLLGGSSGSSTGTLLPPRTAQRIVGGVFTALWVIGCMVIVRRSRFRETSVQ